MNALINANKKKILIVIVALECLLGGIFLWWFVKIKFAERVAHIATINTDTLTFSTHGEFRYYFELKPNTVEKDQPDWLPYEAVYTYNADGLNERYDYEVTKPPNTFRIVTVGDSNTFGHFVNTQDNWPEQLEDMLNGRLSACGFQKFEVINLGAASFDVPYSAYRYVTIGSKYEPDLIIWFEAGPGFTRLNEVMRPLIEECEANSPPPEVNSETYSYYACWNKAGEMVTEKYPPKEFFETVMPYLDEFFQTASSSRVFFLTYTGSSEDERSAEILSLYKQRYPQAVFESVIPDLEKQDILPDNHPSAKGHTRIAEGMFGYLNGQVFSKMCSQ